MNLFRNRPLALILSVFIFAFALCTGASVAIRLSLALFSLLLLLLSLLVRHATRRARRISAACAVALLLASLFTALYFDGWFYADRRFGDEEVTVNGTVCEIPYSNAGYRIFDVMGASVNGRSPGGYRFTVEDEVCAGIPLSVGDTVTFRATLHDFEGNAARNSDIHRRADGYNALCFLSGDLVVGENRVPLYSRVLAIRERGRDLILSRAETRSSGFLAALLIGDRTFLDGQMKLDFARTGISHILAVSGLHLTLLALGADYLLSRFRIPKKPRRACLCLLVLLYMTLTGFPTSVCRAGIMLILSSLLFLFSSASDSVTSLLISVTLILLATPYAVFDISLWLSAFATLGVICSGILLKNRRVRQLPLPLRFLIPPALTTAFAVGATLWLTVPAFGRLSLWVLPANLLLIPCVEGYILLGVFVLIFGGIFPLGRVLDFACTCLCRAVGFLSDTGLGYVASDFPAVRIAVLLFTLSGFLFLICKVNRRRVALLLLLSLLAGIHITAFTMTRVALSSVDVRYYAEEAEETFVSVGDGAVSLLDLSPHLATSAYRILKMLDNLHYPAVSSLLLTSYSRSLVNHLEILAKGVHIERILLPEPQTEEEAEVCLMLAERLCTYRVRVEFYEQGDGLAFGNATVSLLYRTRYGQDSAACVLAIQTPEASTVYVSSGAYTGQGMKIASEAMATADTVIFGCYGSSYREQVHFQYKFENLNRIILSGEGLDLGPGNYDYYKEREILRGVTELSLIH